jgi:hypothetical protein
VKSKLRHPIRSITEPFGKAGLLVAILALVLALVGGAYAAGGLTKSQEKQVKKIAKKYAGKPGAPGANGANGATGPQGPAGASGKNGSDGKSVTVTEIATGKLACEERGGVEVKREGAEEGAEVCNGREGSPWTAGGSLPSGQTETGVWSFGPTPHRTSQEAPELKVETGAPQIPISFPIPLAEPLLELHGCPPFNEPGEPCQFHIFEGEETPPNGCLWEPAPGLRKLAAEPGNLCVYVAQNNTGLTPSGTLIIPEATEGEGGPSLGIGRAGALVAMLGNPSEESSAAGTWAVTAP